MCLISFANKVHPEYPLILIANRDEKHERSTRKAEYWAEEGFPDILGGKDKEAGGTWLGVHKNGKWAALTNYRDLKNLKENPPSRGHLALNFLKNGDNPEEYLKNLQKEAQEYNGFNLLLGTPDEIYHYSNASDIITKVEDGIHGVSNAVLNSPWHKQKRANQKLKTLLEKSHLKKDEYFEILVDEHKITDPNLLPDTGLTLEQEKNVSSIFIRSEYYGTRCSTLLMIHQTGRIEFTERRYKAGTTEIQGEDNFIIK